VDGPWWNLSYLVIFLPFMVAALVLVVSHARRSEEPVERNAALYVAVGIAVGVVTAITELVAPAYTGIPRLGHIGTALCTVLLAVAILRHRLLLDEAPAGRLLVAVLLVLSAALVLGVAVPAVPEPVGGGLLAAVLVAVVALALRRLLFDRLRERIERRERLALVGTMAAGVAHEVRNPLAAIRGAAQFVQREVEIGKLPGESADYLKLILGEVDRLDGVVESFLAFARPMEPKRKDVDPKALVADVVRLQPDPARVTVEVEPGLGPLSADPALLASALSNIVRNAVEAGGKVRVRATSERDGLRAVAAFEVEDDGPGIPEAERDRVGLPFHTTKTKGTGLGVAIAIRAAEAHGGTLAYEPVEPHGCRFTIRIPLRSL
jgi:signal transduction histidine kinase